MKLVTDRPQRAPKDYEDLEPCEERHEGMVYVGSGVPWDQHPRGIDAWWVTRPSCRACESDDVLVIWLAYVGGGFGTGKDLNCEVVCRECGKYSFFVNVD